MLEKQDFQFLFGKVFGSHCGVDIDINTKNRKSYSGCNGTMQNVSVFLPGFFEMIEFLQGIFAGKKLKILSYFW